MSRSSPVTLLTPSGELRLKSRRTRGRFRRALRDNLEATLADRRVDATVDDSRGRIMLEGDAVGAAEAASEVFGVHRAMVAQPLGTTDLDVLAPRVAAASSDRVAGRTFAVRVRRRGHHDWSTRDAERRIGSLLLEHSAGVDLDDPQETVLVVAYDDDTYLVTAEHLGPRGLPVGTQDPVLVLLSGGFDSAVAAWRLLRRGVPVHFVHAELACSQTDSALAVARELTRRWAPGTDPTVWVMDFRAVRERLLADVDSRYRQVRLKELMLAGADRIAAQEGFAALATGEALGQVSTQTLGNLALIDRAAEHPVLRPLAGDDKDDIVKQARRIGTYDLSARSREVCDLSDGPVVTHAREKQLAPARDAAPDTLALQAAEQAWRLPLRSWVPGLPAPWAA
jgi:tRNA uracil 4-sulfurtransferase